MALSQLTEKIIQQYSSAQSFQRGYDYYQQGAVTSLIRRGTLLQAEVEGSEVLPYLVCCTFDSDEDLSTTCTCPYDWGGLCKHIIATCLACIHQPEMIEEHPPLDSQTDYTLLNYMDLFIQRGRNAIAERVVKEHLKEEDPSSNLLAWLQKYYRTRDNSVAEMQVTQTLFRRWPSLNYYQELRTVAQKLDRWETLRQELLAFTKQKGNTTLLIEIAINEEEIDKALELLKKPKEKSTYGYSYTSGYTDFSIELKVARAAKKTHPHAAIQIYQQRAERLIAEKNRNSYQGACVHLVEVKSLYKELEEHETWTKYISSLRQQYKHFPALKNEMKKAGL